MTQTLNPCNGSHKSETVSLILTIFTVEDTHFKSKTKNYKYKQRNNHTNLPDSEICLARKKHPSLAMKIQSEGLKKD